MGRAKVTHMDKSDVRQLTALIRNFARVLTEQSDILAIQLLQDGSLAGIDWKEQDDASLLSQRKKLIDIIKSGMLDRKDKELEIAVFAGVIWTNRLERSRHDRALGLML